MSVVQVEVMAWLSRYFTAKSPGRLTMEKEIGDGATIRDLLEEFAAQNAELGELLFNAKTGRLTGHVTVILNGRLLELAGGLDAKLRSGDSIRLLPTIAGG